MLIIINNNIMKFKRFKVVLFSELFSASRNNMDALCKLLSSDAV